MSNPTLLQLSECQQQAVSMTEEELRQAYLACFTFDRELSKVYATELAARAALLEETEIGWLPSGPCEESNFNWETVDLTLVKPCD